MLLKHVNNKLTSNIMVSVVQSKRKKCTFHANTKQKHESVIILISDKSDLTEKEIARD
jgi:hypothetical protein